MAKKDTAPAADAANEHHLVAEFRRAMANKDIVTMGRLLELLGTMRAELLMGKPVIDQLAAPNKKKESGAGGAANRATQPRSLIARLSR